MRKNLKCLLTPSRLVDNASKFTIYKCPMRSNDNFLQFSVKCLQPSQDAIHFDLQSAFNPRKMLFPRPMSFRPDVSHSLPNMPNMNDFQTLLHLFRQILDVLPVVVG